MEPLSRVLFSLYQDEPHYGDWVIACLEQAWPGLVGPEMAGFSRPVSFCRQVLTVEVPDPVWRSAVAGLENDILRKLRSETGLDIRKIRVSEC